MAEAIKIEGYTKTYKLFMQKQVVHAVDNLSLTVDEGEIFGFLGPNGAGKTTTIKMLLGLTYPSAGQAWVLGRPAGDIEAKKELSYLPESPYFYEYLSGQELLDFYGRIFHLNGRTGKERAEKLLRTVGLYADRNKPLSQYSKGMLQRIGIAQALMNDPKLLIFDEPTSGLDPIAHMEIRDLILRLKSEGKTVFLSSHQLSDVEMVCDRIAILNRGKLLKIGLLDELLAYSEVEIRALGLKKDALDRLCETGARVVSDAELAIVYEQPGDAANKAMDMIISANGQVVSVTPRRRTLEELFMETIKEECS